MKGIYVCPVQSQSQWSGYDGGPGLAHAIQASGSPNTTWIEHRTRADSRLCGAYQENGPSCVSEDFSFWEIRSEDVAVQFLNQKLLRVYIGVGMAEHRLFEGTKMKSFPKLQKY